MKENALFIYRPKFLDQKWTWAKVFVIDFCRKTFMTMYNAFTNANKQVTFYYIIIIG